MINIKGIEMEHFNLYFFYGDKTGNVWFIGARGRGTSENGLRVERTGWRISVTRLNPTYKRLKRPESNV